MKVLDHEKNVWFLLEEGDLYFDAFCNHSVFYYTYSIKLNNEERLAYERDGKKFLNKLAHEINYSAPVARGSTSKFIRRKVSGEYSEKITNAIVKWREENT